MLKCDMMDSGDIVAVVVVAAGTSLGIVDLYMKGDGTVLSALIGLYGAVLGFVFGKSVTQAASVAVEKVASASA